MSVLPRLPERFCLLCTLCPDSTVLADCMNLAGGDARSVPCGESSVRGLGLGSEESESAKSSAFSIKSCVIGSILNSVISSQVRKSPPLDRGCSKIPACTMSRSLLVVVMAMGK